jgi:hypothetical protein
MEKLFFFDDDMAPLLYIKGGNRLIMSYFDNFDNEILNKYANILKIIIIICSSTYRLMVFQISCNFVIV